MTENPDEPVCESSDTSLRSTHVSAYDYVGLNEALLTNKVMLFAYATSIIIVALGIVGISGALIILSFYYPEKADAFVKMLVMVCPMLALLIVNVGKIKAATKRIVNGKPDTAQ
jgi:hypothetical protein